MAGYKFKVFPKGAAGSATALHDGTNGEGYNYYVSGFILQTITTEVYLGDENLTGNADGLMIPGNGQALNTIGFQSRGSFQGYDLRKMYYIGGPVKLILEDK